MANHKSRLDAESDAPRPNPYQDDEAAAAMAAEAAEATEDTEDAAAAEPPWDVPMDTPADDQQPGHFAAKLDPSPLAVALQLQFVAVELESPEIEHDPVRMASVLRSLAARLLLGEIAESGGFGIAFEIIGPRSGDAHREDAHLFMQSYFVADRDLDNNRADTNADVVREALRTEEDPDERRRLLCLLAKLNNDEATAKQRNDDANAAAAAFLEADDAAEEASGFLDPPATIIPAEAGTPPPQGEPIEEPIAA